MSEIAKDTYNNLKFMQRLGTNFILTFSQDFGFTHADKDYVKINLVTIITKHLSSFEFGFP